MSSSGCNLYATTPASKKEHKDESRRPGLLLRRRTPAGRARRIFTAYCHCGHHRSNTTSICDISKFIPPVCNCRSVLSPPMCLHHNAQAGVTVANPHVCKHRHLQRTPHFHCLCRAKADNTMSCSSCDSAMAWIVVNTKWPNPMAVQGYMHACHSMKALGGCTCCCCDSPLQLWNV